MNASVRTGALIALSFAILIGVVAWVGFDETYEGLRRAGLPAFLALGAIQIVVIALQTLAWAVLNRPVNHRVGGRILFEASIVGYAVNIITPSAYLGGEPAKVLYVGRRTHLPYPALAGTVVLAKYLEAMSFFLFFTTATVIAIVTFRGVLFTGNMLPVGIVLVILGIVLLSVCVLLWLSLTRRKHPLTRAVSWCAMVRPRSRFWARLRNTTRKMEEQVNQVFCEEGREAIKAFSIFLTLHVIIFLRPALFLVLAGERMVNLGETGLLFVASQGLLAFQITPGSVGTLDGGMFGVFSLLDLAAPTCMAFLLFTRFWDGVLVGFGALFGAKVGASMLAGHPRGEDVGMRDPEPDEESSEAAD